MTRYGYARVSDAFQQADLARFCDDVRQGPQELQALLSMLRPGDEVYVVRLARLARSLRDLMGIADGIKAAGASLHVIQQAIETKSAGGKLFFTLLEAIAEFEAEVRKERQRTGIAVAKERGVYARQARKPRFDRERIHGLASLGLSVPEIAAAIGAAQFTVRRALRAGPREIAPPIDP